MSARLKKILALGLCWAGLGFAESMPSKTEETASFILSEKQNRISLLIVNHQGAMIDQGCVQLISKKQLCLAWSAWTGDFVQNITTQKQFLGSNPSANFCREQNARPVVLNKANGSQDTYCLFKDQSLISAWSLYLHRKTSTTGAR